MWPWGEKVTPSYATHQCCLDYQLARMVGNPRDFPFFTVFDVWQVCMKKSYTWWMPPARCEKTGQMGFDSSKEGT